MTAADERCERTDLIKTQCAHCLGHTDPVADALAAEAPRHYAVDLETPRTTVAQYPGRCPQCAEAIHPGDTITLRGPVDARAWCCTECEP